uniref:CW-type domain-containing protein n=1 Tax=Amphimedon queenslandica TaxID=400682 RepID=A0A1X7U7J3_AMPQE
MSTEARVPDSSVLDDSLEESGASPIIPIIKYSPIRLTPAAAACNISLSYEEDIQKNDTITKTHKKDIVTESPVSSPPPSLSPKLKIVPCFGKKGKGTTTSAKKRPPLKAKSPPPPPPPSCSSSQEETSNGVKSLSVQSDNMSAREGSPSQPLKPGDDASVEARAPPTIPTISEVLEETDSTAKVRKGRKKMAEFKEKGVSLKIKDTKNANKIGKVAKKVEKIIKEVEKDGAAGRNKNSATSKKKGAQKAKKISGTDKATEEKTLKVTETPLQEMNNEEQNEEEKERAKRELEEFLKEEEKLDQKIQAERKRLSQTNNSIKSKTSKKCTVSTKTESIISTSPDQLNTTPPFYMTQSQPSSESYSSEEFLPSPKSKQNDESASPPSNKEKENDGIWVQCDNPDCLKWRFLINVKDPMDLPDKWYCDMNKDSKYNSCIIEEEKWSSLDTDEVYVYSPYTPGSLLLAKLEGYPWWPGIIEADPDTDTYYEAKNEKGGKPSPATPVSYKPHIHRLCVLFIQS